MPNWWTKLCDGISKRHRIDGDLSDEMQAHLDLIADEYRSLGLSDADARLAARREFGNATLVRERANEAWRFPPLETIWQDLRYGARSIRRSPAFALMVTMTLALGIGVNVALFSVVYTALLRPLPFPGGERLVRLNESSGKTESFSVTWLNFQHWRAENHSFEEMVAYTTTDLTLTGHGEARLLHGGEISHTFFALTGEQAILGSILTEADDRFGATRRAVLGYNFWVSVLGADPNVIGKTLLLSGKAYEVAGVLRPGPSFFPRPMNFYLPMGLTKGNIVSRGQHGSIQVLARLKPGVSIATAKTDIDGIMERLALADPGPENDHRVFAQSLTQAISGDSKETLLILMAAVSLLLLIACANVAGLLLVRGTARSREMAIRGAIGAGGLRLARQLITENLLLAAIGGTVGLLLAQLCLRALVLAGPRSIPRLAEVRLDLPVLLFAIVLTGLVGLLAGLAPVFSAARTDVASALRDGTAGSGTGRKVNAFRNALVIAEMVITLVLAFGAGLLLRSLLTAQNTNPGFDQRNVLALELQLPGASYASHNQVRQFYGTLVENLRREPGVESVGAVGCPPATGECGDYWYSVVGRPDPARGDVPITLFNTADSSYFATLRMHLLAGRTFSEADREGSPAVAVMNEQLAKQWWPTPQQAIGAQIKKGGPYMEGSILTVVGVVANESQMGLDQKQEPQLYLAFAQNPAREMAVMVKTVGPSAALFDTIRRNVAALDRNVPIQSLRPLKQWMGASLDSRRFTTLLLTGFAVLAMALAMVGIYGVLNYWVSIRQKEIAVRVALGASQNEILRWVAKHAGRLTAIAAVLGVLGAWGASRWMESLVFGVSARDPWMIALAVLLMAAMVAAACLGPIRRAMHVDPGRSMREEG